MNKDISKRTFDFALSIIKLSNTMIQEDKEFIITKQLIRSGTSIGANVREAQNASSRKDFIYKIAIAQRECDETLYWLELKKELEHKYLKKIEELHDEGRQLLKIISTIIIRVKENNNSLS